MTNQIPLTHIYNLEAAQQFDGEIAASEAFVAAEFLDLNRFGAFDRPAYRAAIGRQWSKLRIHLLKQYDPQALAEQDAADLEAWRQRTSGRGKEGRGKRIANKHSDEWADVRADAADRQAESDYNHSDGAHE